MGYSLDLSAITLQDYLRLLKAQTLLPGRRMLHEQIDERFLLLAQSGVMNVSQLHSLLGSPQKLASLSEKTGIPGEYLTLLRRELGSLVQKPVLLSDFLGCDESRISALAVSGFRNSKEYWEASQDPAGELYALCDLVRINGVGAVAARAFYEAGFCSVSAVAEASAPDMLAHVSAVNAGKGYYKAKLGEKDMQFCIDYAQLLIRFG